VVRKWAEACCLVLFLLPGLGASPARALSDLVLPSGFSGITLNAPAPIPEPNTALLLGFGLLGLGIKRRRQVVFH